MTKKKMKKKVRVNWTIDPIAWKKLNDYIKLKIKKGQNTNCSKEVEKLIFKAFSNPIEIAKEEAKDLNKKFQAKLEEIKELEKLAEEIKQI